MDNSWEKQQIIDIMSGSQKTRYKSLNSEQLIELEKSLLLVSKAKKNSYDKAIMGFKPDSLTTEVLNAILILQHNMIDNSDISMYHL